VSLLFLKGDLLASRDDALVNAVNTVRVMGKGIALKFKRRFPANFSTYKEACARNEVKVGKMFVTHHSEPPPHWIINFPTKAHWSQPSKMEWSIAGLQDLQEVIRKQNIRSVALPALGCGSGGLNWLEVRAVLQGALENMESIDIHIYEPHA
jgi:O-acetyl-ADP-ribose deacetylase (regulator of RNase III)